MDNERQYVSGALPPVVWSSPTKYYPAKPGSAAPILLHERPALSCNAESHSSCYNKDAQSSKALLILQERLAHVTAGSKQQLAHAAAAFQQQLADVQAASATKQEALQQRLVQQFCRRRQQLRLGSCLLAWRCQQQYQQQQSQQLRMLALILQAWHLLVHTLRAKRVRDKTAAFNGWHAHAYQQSAVARRIATMRNRRSLKLLLAWLQLSTAQQEARQQRMAWAQHWCCRRLLHRCYGSWKQQWTSKQQLVHAHREQQQDSLMQKILQDWQTAVQQQHCAQERQQTTAAQNRMHLQCTLSSCRKLVGAGCQVATRHHRRRLLDVSMTIWLQLPAANLRLRAISAAVRSVYMQQLQQWGYRAFCVCCSESVAARRSARLCLRAWSLAAAAGEKQRHWVRVRAQRRRWRLLEACVRGWVCATWQAARRSAAWQAGELKAAVASSEAQSLSSQAQLEVLMSHQQRLVELVRAASRAAAPELPLAPTLHWQCVPAAPGSHRPLLQPRARHAAFALQGLQPPQPTLQELQQYLQTHSVSGRHSQQHSHSRSGCNAGIDAAQPAAAAAGMDGHSTHRVSAGSMPVENITSSNGQGRGQGADTEAGLHCPLEVSGCLVVFGGVGAGGGCLTDVSLAVMTDNNNNNSSSSSSSSLVGNCCVVAAVPLSCTPTPYGLQAKGAQGGMPVPVWDFAACECGPAAFVVVGGFDSSSASMQLQRCVLTYSRSSTLQGAAAAAQSATSMRRTATSGSSLRVPEAAQPQQHETPVADNHHDAACHTAKQQQQQQSVTEWAASWACTWEVLQPQTRSPVGRCYHSCCWHAASSSLVVFGGYASRQGCLNDVQVYNLGHREWWQPGYTGCWPCRRRSHAAAVLGDALWVHGGLDSSGCHLDDLWRLDLRTWQWQQLGGKAGNLVGSSAPVGRRAHCLAGAQGRYLLVHGGYSGTCELLQDAWLYDMHRDCWMQVDLTAEAADQPVARALHTVTYLAQQFIVVGGQTSLGPLGQVGMMCSPAVLHARQLQQQALQQELQLAQAQQRGLKLQAQCSSYEAQLEFDEAAGQALRQEADAADRFAAGAFNNTKAAHAALKAAEAAAVSAEARLQASEELICTLERRLVRARGGGRKALAAAAAAQA